MKFETKNNFIVKHKNARYFYADLALFKKVFPTHRLHDDLRRANDFNRHILDGKMLYELLNKISPEDILENRETPMQQVAPATGEAPQESAGTPASAASETDPDKPVESETAKPETVVVETAPEEQKKSKVKEVNK
jgi:hypothetical protein